MKLATTLTATALAWTACSIAGPAAPLPIEPGKSFSLRPGESAQTSDAALQVGFEGVTADSRCPKGVQCVWAGDATVRIWLQRGAGPREARELHVAPSATQAVRVMEHELRLVRLDPYPLASKAPAPGDYVATLMLSRAAAAAPER
jgi:hypothetical protein